MSNKEQKIKTLTRIFLAFAISFGPLFIFTDAAHAACVHAHETQMINVLENAGENPEPQITTIETCGGDDTSYKLPLSVDVTFDGQSYSDVYVTTNSVITFGQPDGTYWTYPNTPSISLYSMDWVIFPDRGDEHLVIQTSDGGFSIDISARPYGMWDYTSYDPTKIIITAAINIDGSVAISYFTAGPTYDWTRTGVRLVDGSVVTLEQYGIIEVEQPPVLPPEPVDPTPEPTPEPPVEPTPEPTVEPTPEPPVEPTPTPEPPVEPTPTPEPPVEPEPTPQPEPEPEPTPETPIQPVLPEEPFIPELPIQPTEPVEQPTEPVVDPETPTEPQPEPENPTVPEEPTEAPEETFNPEQAMEEARKDDIVLSEELAAIPFIGDVAGVLVDIFNEFGNAGADMSPEVREKSEEVVVSAIIVGQIAQMATASVVASNRRIK